MKIKTLQFNYVTETITHTIYNTNFLKFIIFHFFIASTEIRFFCLDLCFA